MPTTVVELSGPDFVKNANAATRTLKPSSVGELRVKVGSIDPDSPQVKAAVQVLKRYMTPNASVYFITSGAATETARPGSSPMSAPMGLGVQLFMLNTTDYENAANIAKQMQADNQKQQMERWKLQQETQTKIFEVQQDITVNRAKTQDKAYKKWDEYIRG